MCRKEAIPTQLQDLYHWPFEIGLCSAKERGMAVSAVWTLVYLLATLPSGTKEHANIHGRDALCPSAKIQKHATFGINRSLRQRIREGLSPDQ